MITTIEKKMNETQEKFKCEYSNENYATDSAGGVVT